MRVMVNAARPRLAALDDLAAPLPLLAIGLMAINDFWAKPAFHNWITGKLSDVAICFFLPVYLSAALGAAAPTLASRTARVAIGAAITASLLVMIKTSALGADLYAAIVGGVGRYVGVPGGYSVVDPTDLVALPMTLLAIVHERARSMSARFVG